MITADENFSTIHKSAEVGAQAYIVKPFSFEDVLNAITRYVSRSMPKSVVAIDFLCMSA
jgi:response regulator of citrate/malate metabolism